MPASSQSSFVFVSHLLLTLQHKLQMSYILLMICVVERARKRALNHSFKYHDWDSYFSLLVDVLGLQSLKHGKEPYYGP